MNRQKYLPLLGVALFCLTSMAGCPNVEPGGQLTEVKGQVINVRTGKPLGGVRILLASKETYPALYLRGVDSTQTDPQGNYQLSFTNEYGLYYAVSCEGVPDYARLAAYRLDFADSAYFEPTFNSYTTKNLRTVDLPLGQKNTVRFRASPRRVFAVQLATRQTGYQRLILPGLGLLPADNQSRLVYLYQSLPLVAGKFPYFYGYAGTPPAVVFSRTLAGGATQDTLVRVKPSTPLTGDTVRASLQVGR